MDNNRPDLPLTVYDFEEEALLRLHDSLRAEINRADVANYQIIGSVVAASVVIFGFSLQRFVNINSNITNNSNAIVTELYNFPLIMLFPYLIFFITFPANSIMIQSQRSVWRLTTYIRVFIEPYLKNVSWEAHLAHHDDIQKNSNIGFINSKRLVFRDTFRWLESAAWIFALLLAIMVLSSDFLNNVNSSNNETLLVGILLIIASSIIVYPIYFYQYYIRRGVASRTDLDRNGKVERNSLVGWILVKVNDDNTPLEPSNPAAIYIGRANENTIKTYIAENILEKETINKLIYLFPEIFEDSEVFELINTRNVMQFINITNNNHLIQLDKKYKKQLHGKFLKKFYYKYRYSKIYYTQSISRLREVISLTAYVRVSILNVARYIYRSIFISRKIDITRFIGALTVDLLNGERVNVRHDIALYFKANMFDASANKLIDIFASLFTEGIPLRIDIEKIKVYERREEADKILVEFTKRFFKDQKPPIEALREYIIENQDQQGIRQLWQPNAQNKATQYMIVDFAKTMYFDLLVGSSSETQHYVSNHQNEDKYNAIVEFAETIFPDLFTGTDQEAQLPSIDGIPLFQLKE